MGRHMTSLLSSWQTHVCLATLKRWQSGNAYLTHELYVLGLIRVFFHEELKELYELPADLLGFDGGSPDKGLVLIIIAAARGSGKMDLKGTARSILCADIVTAT